MIDVYREELKLRVHDDEVKFSVFNALPHPVDSDACFMIEAVEAIMSRKCGLTDPFETRLVQSDNGELGEEAEEYVKWMESFEPNKRKYYEPLGENTHISVPSIERPP